METKLPSHPARSHAMQNLSWSGSDAETSLRVTSRNTHNEPGLANLGGAH
jgi:hypothetical protein